jgi:hypothetical protein
MEVSGQLLDPAALFPGKQPLAPIVYETMRAPEPVSGRCGEDKNIFPPPGIEP